MVVCFYVLDQLVHYIQLKFYSIFLIVSRHNFDSSAYCHYNDYYHEAWFPESNSFKNFEE